MKTKYIWILWLFVCVSLSAQEFLADRNPVLLTHWAFKKGDWSQAHLADISEEGWEQVQVPHTYSMDAITQTGYYQGTAWYRTRSNITPEYKGQRVFIRFEGVGQEAELFVNEKSVGKHVGSYSAFCFEITEAIRQGSNIFSLKVSNKLSSKVIPITDDLFNVYGGIYRPVTLFTTPATHISPLHYASPGIYIKTDSIAVDKAHISGAVRVHSSAPESKSQLQYKVLDRNGLLVHKGEKTITVSQNKSQTETIRFELQNPVRWHAKNNPYLYTLEVQLTANGKTDRIRQSFGVRTFRIDADKGFFLNEKLYSLYGVSRHQEWEREGPALTDSHHNEDMALIDEMGATAVRFAHYQQADLLYSLADEMGIVAWAEIPFVHDWSGREGENAKQQLKELIYQNYNHPSICFWGLWNEVRDWDNGENAPCTQLTKELNAIAHEIDPDRVTTSASDRDYGAPMVGITDVQGWNKYFGWYYGKYKDMGSWLDKTHRTHPGVKIGISEYGIGANPEHQDSTRVEKPKGHYFPEQEQTKYHEITWPQLKSRDYVWGTFVWNMFDFSVNSWNRGGVPNLNHKGLVSFDRKIKKDAFYYYKAQWSEEPIVYITEARNINRKQGVIDVKIYSNLKTVTLYVNGIAYEKRNINPEDKTVLFRKVKLKKGSNSIDAIAKTGTIRMTHHVEWRFDAN